MEGILLTTRGGNNEYLFREISKGFYEIILGIILYLSELFIIDDGKIDFLIISLSIIAVITGIYHISSIKKLANTYVDFYNDHVEGMGKTKEGFLNFWIKTDEILDVKTKPKEVYIYTTSEKYRIITGEYDSQQALIYFIKNKS